MGEYTVNLDEFDNSINQLGIFTMQTGNIIPSANILLSYISKYPKYRTTIISRLATNPNCYLLYCEIMYRSQESRLKRFTRKVLNCLLLFILFLMEKWKL
ncbi:MAG: hypothetical protein A2287_04745 [Candidatus Melainabacteria bacterium RIFOXYA12_FULL_32_12]|nr:MAG: hypothetical protein A2287_04745 [Candidatus Melainabacteria bacterium RIFOXYA12_FULL_32_12]